MKKNIITSQGVAHAKANININANGTENAVSHKNTVGQRNEKQRTTLQVMCKLITLVAPLSVVMAIAIGTGVLGFLCAIGISVLGGYGVLVVLSMAAQAQGAAQGSVQAFVIFPEWLQNLLANMPQSQSSILLYLFIGIALCAILRGVLHYIEQSCNHYIAFKLLAHIRDKVFTALRKLAPAKLDGADTGNLISILTGDIELLEVFYAHTISPICIASMMSVLLVGFIGQFHPLLGGIALVAYLFVGVCIPWWASCSLRATGEAHRAKFGALSGYFLDSVRGMREVLQYQCGAQRQAALDRRTDALEDTAWQMKRSGALVSCASNFAVLGFSLLVFFVAAALHLQGAIGVEGVLIATITMFSSFGAVVALANLGAGLTQTIASGNRVLDLLEEAPMVEDVTDSVDIAQVLEGALEALPSKTPLEKSCETFSEASFDAPLDTLFAEPADKRLETQTAAALSQVHFAYENEPILQGHSLAIKRGEITGITGKSGCGKSTTLKLLMRFWDAQSGDVTIAGHNVSKINTASLRKIQSFVTQDTHLFHDSIANNLRLAKPDATEAELVAACQKASVHDFIKTLPLGYDTPVGELGGTLSGGERQRLGIARAFLHDASLLLLDEPTSNLDSLNEAVILRALDQDKNRTTVLVSHRASTMKIAQQVYHLETNRQS